MGASLNDLDPDLRAAATALVAAAGRAGLQPRVTSTLRSRAEQTRLYRRSQQGLSPYPVAPPGTSAHEYGWAFDLVVSPFDAIRDVGYTWQQWGGTWAGEKDLVHFELPGASAEAARLGSQESSLQRTSLTEDVLNFFYGFIPVLGRVQMAADLAMLFPALSKNDSLYILANPTRFPAYIKRLIGAYLG